MENKSNSVSVVIPVYNSAETLDELTCRLHKTLHEVSNQYEIIMVNDGSQDQSWETIKQLATTNPYLDGIDLMRNFGQHNALLAGIRDANFDVVITLDDDLQNPPEEIPILLDELNKGYDVVYGAPRREQHGIFRNLASQATKLTLQRSMGVESAKHVSSFRAFRTSLRNGFEDYRSPFLSIDVLLSWGARRISYVEVNHVQRNSGQSGYSLSKLISHAINMITGFTIIPLRIASLVGFGFTLFGLGVLLYVLGRFILQGSSVAGFPFLASLIAILSGAQLFALGIMGEYLARMHFRLMEKPPYVIRDNTKFSDGEYEAGYKKSPVFHS